MIRACPSDQGCSAGACVSACESAEANKSSVGCDYYSVDPVSWDTLSGATNCFAAFVTNTDAIRLYERRGFRPASLYLIRLAGRT